MKFKKRIGIITGGGDVPPLNSVISSVKDSANEYNYELLGFLYGWKGILENTYVSLNNSVVDPLIGGTVLKSSRINLAKIRNGDNLVMENLNKLNIDGLIVIGGEDTLSNSFYLKDIPQVLISKTIDNDVGILNSDHIVNLFTLGYPTAAEKISSFVSINEGLRTTAYSHERIIVVESMGMHAGWLALSSSFGNPDFIIIPEFGLDYEVFLQNVKERYLLQKNIIIVIAEGASWSDGSFVSADVDEMDSFGHPRFLGSAIVLASKLKKDLLEFFDTRNVNSVNSSYLYRSGPPNELDYTAAKLLGNEAVKIFTEGFQNHTLLTTNFREDALHVERYPMQNINSIEKLYRFVPECFYNSSKYKVTTEGKKYLSKIIRELPKIEYGI